MIYRFETQRRLRGRRKHMPRYQTGSLRKERLANGSEQWLLRYQATRATDGKRVERTAVVGSVDALGDTKEAAQREVERLHLDRMINPVVPPKVPTFGDLAASYLEHELDRLAHTTAATTKHNLLTHILPRWTREVAVDIKPLEVEAWLKALVRGGMANTTAAKLKQHMQTVFKHGQRSGMISRGEEGNPMKFVRASTRTSYRPIAITPDQACLLIEHLEDPVRTLTILSAATGLRVSESLGLTWKDIDFDAGVIHVRRTWTKGKIGRPKTESSANPVPLHPVLADSLNLWRLATCYSKDSDFVFASDRLNGRQPREANLMSADYLRPAAVKVGIIPPDFKGKLGFHSLRHGLSHALINSGVDPKTVQELLRHSRVQTTLDLYTRSMPATRLAAQGQILDVLFKKSA